MSTDESHLIGKPVYIALIIRDPVAFRNGAKIGDIVDGMEVLQVSTHPSFLIDQLKAEGEK